VTIYSTAQMLEYNSSLYINFRG